MLSVVITPEKFAAAAERLPTTPQIYSRLSAAMKDPDVGLDEIVNIVRVDASLSARVLRLSNSPVFGRGEPVSSLLDAINRTGMDEIYRLVGAAMSSQLYVTGLPTYGVGGDELSTNSLSTALAMEFLAEKIGENRSAAYTLGLLRSVGRLVLQRIASTSLCPPLSGRKANAELVHVWERDTFGITHADAAEKLFSLWKFPAGLAAPVRHHFVPGQDPEHNRLAALLHVCSWISESVGNGLPIEREAWTLSDKVLLQAGITKELAEECADHTRTATAAMNLMLTAA